MTTLLDNPLPIAVVGGLVAVLTLVVFLSRRDLASLAALCGAVGVTLLLLIVERLVQTDEEQVKTALAEAMDAVEVNDVQQVINMIDPAAAQMRADAAALMPLVKWTSANAGNVEVIVDAAAHPPTAAARFRAFLNGVHVQSGIAVPYLNQQVELRWTKQGDRWLIDDYAAFYDGKPIDAVKSAAGNRPVASQ